jgi:hypothetical protein
MAETSMAHLRTRLVKPPLANSLVRSLGLTPFGMMFLIFHIFLTANANGSSPPKTLVMGNTSESALNGWNVSSLTQKILRFFI